MVIQIFKLVLLKKQVLQNFEQFCVHPVVLFPILHYVKKERKGQEKEKKKRNGSEWSLKYLNLTLSYKITTLTCN